MKKILLIVKREIAVKISDKFFIALTALAPILFVIIFKLYDSPKFFEDVKVGDSLLTFMSIFGAIAIYFIIFFYSIRTMHSVLEEKSNRIIEVIISSVKPFQLMMGKILGITAVVFMQIIVWVFLTTILAYAVGSLSPDTATSKEVTQNQVESSATADLTVEEGKLSKALAQIPVQELVSIFLFFIFYLTGGFILYSALFAAIGSMADSDTDTIQFMIPVMIPLLFALTVVPSVFKNPHNDIAFWTSFIPFTSPVVMMMRAPFGVPWWQIGLSMISLVAGIFLTAYIAAKIYRIAILAYGKKVTIKTLYKWLVVSK